jgi:hypothetical protein
MFAALFRMHRGCPRCGHVFIREPGFFQGAMYVSYGLGLGIFFVLALASSSVLAGRIGLVPALLLAAGLYFLGVPLLFRYSRVIWAHLNVGTLPPGEGRRER